MDLIEFKEWCIVGILLLCLVFILGFAAGYWEHTGFQTCTTTTTTTQVGAQAPTLETKKVCQ